MYLPFGLSSSPSINDGSVKEILRVMEHHEQILLTDFVDDLLGEAATFDQATAKFITAVRFLLKVGIPVSDKLTGLRPPAQVQTWTGWIFDTVRCILTVEVGECKECQRRWRLVLIRS